MDSFNAAPCQNDSACHSWLVVPLSTFVTKHHRRLIQTVQDGFSYPEKDPRVAPCRAGKVPDMVLQSREGHEKGTNVCFFFLFREPGSPLSSFVSTDPTTAPCLMASRGATNHNTATLTHQPHSTRVYYHTTILQPNTVNRDNEGRKC